MTPAHEIERVVAGEHADPHSVLGAHPGEGGIVVRVFRPGAASLRVLPQKGEPVELALVHQAGVFEGVLPRRRTLPALPPRGRLPRRAPVVVRDPYSFAPDARASSISISSARAATSGSGTRSARIRARSTATTGTAFAVWAPEPAPSASSATSTSGTSAHIPMRALGAAGVWELFVPEAAAGHAYKFEIRGADGVVRLKADPARAARRAAAEDRLGRASSRITRWGDAAWMERRRALEPHAGADVDLRGAPRLVAPQPAEGNRSLTYRELADELADYALELGFTHVELMPVMEHPFTGSWGYQVTGYFAPTSRYGTPDDFRDFVDRLHQRGIGVILDWVPAHFPRDEHRARALRRHAPLRARRSAPRRASRLGHARSSTTAATRCATSCVANALFWLDAVPRRRPARRRRRLDALPRLLAQGGRVDPEPATAAARTSRRSTFLRAAQRRWCTATSPARSRSPRNRRPGPASRGRRTSAASASASSGTWAGCTTRSSTSGSDPVHRSYHHDELTFRLMYAFTENFVLPLSHDEVVHGKGSLLDKMPGDHWQQLANLRALLRLHVGAPRQEAAVHGRRVRPVSASGTTTRSLDWHLLERPEHRGVQRSSATSTASTATSRRCTSSTASPPGSSGSSCNDAAANVIAFARFSAAARARRSSASATSRRCRATATASACRARGRWREVLNTRRDASTAAAASATRGAIDAEELAWHGQQWSAELDAARRWASIWLAPK